MESRRDGDHDRVDGRVLKRGSVITVAAGAPVPLSESFGLRRIAAGIAADNVSAEVSQMTAVHAGDEAAAEKRDMHRTGHRLIILAARKGFYSRMTDT